MQQSVLIIAGEGDFSRTVMGRWQSELAVPAFTVMDVETYAKSPAVLEQLVIFGEMKEQKLRKLLEGRGNRRPTICVVPTQAQAVAIRKSFPRVIAFGQHEGWVDQLVLLAVEVLRRAEIGRRADEIEAEMKRLQNFATLGQYMTEMQHGLNNALTSVLGNAELLLLEPGRFSAEMREQLETIHNMTLRMHEILQRFSSLESELKFSEKTSHGETVGESHEAAEGVQVLWRSPANAAAAGGYPTKLK